MTKLLEPTEITTSANIRVLHEILHGHVVNYIALKTFSWNDVVHLDKKRSEDISHRQPWALALAVSLRSDKADYLSGFVVDLNIPEIASELSFLSKPSLKIVGHDLKDDMLTMLRLGVRLHENVYDSYVAEKHLELGRFDEAIENEQRRIESVYADNPTFASITLNNWKRRFFAEQYSFRNLLDKYGLPHVPDISVNSEEPVKPEHVMTVWNHAKALAELYPAQYTRLAVSGVQSYLEQTAFPLIVHLADIKHQGVKANAPRLLDARETAKAAIEVRTDRLRDLYGVENARSESQVRDAFTGLEALQFLTDRYGNQNLQEDVLRRAIEPLKLAGNEPAAQLARDILGIRSEMSFLGGIDAILMLLGDDDRFHPDIEQYGTKTARISEQLGNMDKRLANAIVPSGPGLGIGESDISGADVFSMAGLSDDEPLQEAYEAPGDVYLREGTEVFPQLFDTDEIAAIRSGLEYAPDKTPTLKGSRTLSKNTLLSVAYGQTPEGVAAKSKQPVLLVQRGIQRLEERHPALFGYFAAQVESGRRSRHIQLPSLKIALSESRLENRCRNYPVQTTTAMLFNQALLQVCRYLHRMGGRVLMTIFDSIVFEAPLERLERCAQGIEIHLQTIFGGAFPNSLASLKVKTDISNPSYWSRGEPKALSTYLADLEGKIAAAQGCQKVK